MDAGKYYWSWSSLALYCILGFVGMNCAEMAFSKGKKALLNRYYISWYLVWLFFAVFRKVSPGLGGADANSYVDYFQHCLDAVQTNIYSYRTEVGWRLFNKVIRYITGDYHLLFVIVYSVIIWSLIYFIHEFWGEYSNKIPLFVVVYGYLITFNIIRSGFAIALCLIASVLLYKKKYLSSVVLAIASIFIHSASVFYVGFWIFYWLYKRKEKIQPWKLLGWSIIGSWIGRIVQILILSNKLTNAIAGTPLKVYAAISLNSSFFEDYWKIVVQQLLLIVALLLFNKRISCFVESITDIEIKFKIKYVQLMCSYDLLLIPAMYILHVWRAVDYFFLPRLIMWGLILNILQGTFIHSQRWIISASSYIVTVIYFVFRIFTVYDISCLMPYLLDLEH